MPGPRTSSRPSARVLAAVAALIALSSAGVGAILDSGLSALDGDRHAVTPPASAVAPPPAPPKSVVLPGPQPARAQPQPASPATSPAATAISPVVAEMVRRPPARPVRGTVMAAATPTTVQAPPVEQAALRQIVRARAVPVALERDGHVRAKPHTRPHATPHPPAKRQGHGHGHGHGTAHGHAYR